ncbi:hypothetical protein EIP91_004220 [Steccherinum ochraceum]|uniref:Uncharacterized protein n=1 Tax=Steccherinum ochraceum TaxID=92696 RepID=A0A4R0R985_9APHY|nr:hypothetical protein EIP91_004220 [Steccherinum ochraceum]
MVVQDSLLPRIFLPLQLARPMQSPAIPVELWLRIFALACTNDSGTGCALNGTSKVFRDICLRSSLDIQFVAIYGRAGIRSFLNTISQREHRVVRSLLLRCDFEDASQGDVTYGDGRECARLVLSVLHAVSPAHLRILHIFSYSSDFVIQPITPPEGSTTSGPTYPPSCLPISFQSLVDLHLTMPLHQFNFPNTFKAISPSLQSLHIHVTPCSFGAMLAREFPLLRELVIESVTAETSRGLRWFLYEFCRPELGYPQPPALRTVQVHLLQYATAAGFTLFPASVQWGTDWQWSFVRDVMTHWTDNEVRWKGRRLGGEGVMEVDKAIEFWTEARTVVVFPPLQTEVLAMWEVQDVRLRDQWEASKKTWNETTSQLDIIV